LKVYAGHGEEVLDAIGSCDSSFILSGSVDKSIIYWDVSTGLPVRRLRTQAAGVTCVKFNEDSSVALSGSRDNSIHTFDIRSRSLNPIQILKEAKDCITGLQVTSNKIFSSSLDGCIRSYDIRVGELACYKINIPITSLSMTSDEQCLIASCQDEAIRLIDIDNSDILAEYRGHKGSKDYRIECTVMKGDAYVITGSSYGQAIIYDFLEANEVRRLNVGSEVAVIQTLCKHPLTDEILIGNRREIQLWNLKDYEEIMED
jgi:mitogen-activated protein kinase organizer 1